MIQAGIKTRMIWRQSTMLLPSDRHVSVSERIFGIDIHIDGYRLPEGSIHKSFAFMCMY